MTQRLSAAQFQAQYGNGAKVDPASGIKPQIRLPAPRKMNKTESSFFTILNINYPPDRFAVRYEPFSLQIPSGNYKPDFVVIEKATGAVKAIYETKGPHIHSAASIRAFKEAKAHYNFWRFVFAQKRDGAWTFAE